MKLQKKNRMKWAQITALLFIVVVVVVAVVIGLGVGVGELLLLLLLWLLRVGGPQRMLQRLFLTGSGGSRAARMASSKTFLRPFWVRAEHSTYLTALSSRASFSPWSMVMTRCLFLASFSTVAASSRRSICVPTSRKGVFWQWCVISGTPFSLTFSNDDGDTTEKQTRKTSVCG